MQTQQAVRIGFELATDSIQFSGYAFASASIIRSVSGPTLNDITHLLGAGAAAQRQHSINYSESSYDKHINENLSGCLRVFKVSKSNFFKSRATGPQA